jgi:hypothetical protein
MVPPMLGYSNPWDGPTHVGILQPLVWRQLCRATATPGMAPPMLGYSNPWDDATHVATTTPGMAPPM